MVVCVFRLDRWSIVKLFQTVGHITTVFVVFKVRTPLRVKIINNKIEIQ